MTWHVKTHGPSRVACASVVPCRCAVPTPCLPLPSAMSDDDAVEEDDTLLQQLICRPHELPAVLRGTSGPSHDQVHCPAPGCPFSEGGEGNGKTLCRDQVPKHFRTDRYASWHAGWQLQVPMKRMATPQPSKEELERRRNTFFAPRGAPPDHPPLSAAAPPPSVQHNATAAAQLLEASESEDEEAEEAEEAEELAAGVPAAAAPPGWFSGVATSLRQLCGSLASLPRRVAEEVVKIQRAEDDRLAAERLAARIKGTTVAEVATSAGMVVHSNVKV